LRFGVSSQLLAAVLQRQFGVDLIALRCDQPFGV
jgi:hypothetical protein